MINDFIKWLAKFVLIGTVWVFIFSVTIAGRPIFSYAHDVLVDNAVVHYLDGQLADLWDRVTETARITFKQIGSGDEKG